MSGLLLTQCLQKDFVEPLDKFDPLPNALHVGYKESQRLLFGNTEEDPVRSTISWAYSVPDEKLKLVHVRDWHNPDDPLQKAHLSQFGQHCIANSNGARFVFEDRMDSSRNHFIIDATGLNDFVETNLGEVISPFMDSVKRAGIMGVWTEAKVYFTAYEFRTRYPDLEIGVCSALTASSSRQMHFLALDQLRDILGVQIFSSPGAFAEWLTGSSSENFTMPSVTKHSRLDNTKLQADIPITDDDEALLLYLFRNSKEVQLKSLDGGFSGNLVLAAKSVDTFGHKHVPSVVKAGPRDMIAKERSSFERIQEVLGNNAPAIIDYAEIKDRGAILYRYASMLDGKVHTFQELFTEGKDISYITRTLTTVFQEQLGRLYQAGSYDELNLLDYYEFSSKYAESVAGRLSEITGETITVDQPKIKDPVTGKELYNAAAFYGKDLKESSGETVAGGHKLAYLHGDLNGRNIIIDAHDNVWLIDFFHTHRGHILKDLIKLESDLIYIMTPMQSDEDVKHIHILIDLLIDQPDLGVPYTDSDLKALKLPANMERTGMTILHLRRMFVELVGSDRSPYQIHVALLRYAVHTLSFDECNLYQKKAALYAACRLAEKTKNALELSAKLRFDFLNINEPKIALTILPGRKDRLRNPDKDIEEIVASGFKTVLNLVTPPELDEYGVEDINEKYKEAGLSVIEFPILDQKAPSIDSVPALLEKIDHAVKYGPLLIHCVGGLGRSGMVAALYLVSKGYSSQQAVRIVRDARSERAIETSMQMNLIFEYEKGTPA